MKSDPVQRYHRAFDAYRDGLKLRKEFAVSEVLLDNANQEITRILGRAGPVSDMPRPELLLAGLKEAMAEALDDGVVEEHEVENLVQTAESTRALWVRFLALPSLPKLTALAGKRLAEHYRSVLEARLQEGLEEADSLHDLRHLADALGKARSRLETVSHGLTEVMADLGRATLPGTQRAVKSAATAALQAEKGTHDLAAATRKLEALGKTSRALYAPSAGRRRVLLTERYLQPFLGEVKKTAQVSKKQLPKLALAIEQYGESRRRAIAGVERVSKEILSNRDLASHLEQVASDLGSLREETLSLAVEGAALEIALANHREPLSRNPAVQQAVTKAIQGLGGVDGRGSTVLADVERALDECFVKAERKRFFERLRGWRDVLEHGGMTVSAKLVSELENHANEVKDDAWDVERGREIARKLSTVFAGKSLPDGAFVTRVRPKVDAVEKVVDGATKRLRDCMPRIVEVLEQHFERSRDAVLTGEGWNGTTPVRPIAAGPVAPPDVSLPDGFSKSRRTVEKLAHLTEWQLAACSKQAALAQHIEETSKKLSNQLRRTLNGRDAPEHLRAQLGVIADSIAARGSTPGAIHAGLEEVSAALKVCEVGEKRRPKLVRAYYVFGLGLLSVGALQGLVGLAAAAIGVGDLAWGESTSDDIAQVLGALVATGLCLAPALVHFELGLRLVLLKRVGLVRILLSTGIGLSFGIFFIFTCVPFPLLGGVLALASFLFVKRLPEHAAIKPRRRG